MGVTLYFYVIITWAPILMFSTLTEMRYSSMYSIPLACRKEKVRPDCYSLSTKMAAEECWHPCRLCCDEQRRRCTFSPVPTFLTNILHRSLITLWPSLPIIPPTPSKTQKYICLKSQEKIFNMLLYSGSFWIYLLPSYVCSDWYQC